MKATLKELRARADITQDKLASMIGVNAATYNAWEKLSAGDVKKIAALFGVQPQDIIIPRAESKLK